ncbi:hypothetical protein LINPERHAP2_LOCUS14496 [Linum perenne]
MRVGRSSLEGGSELPYSELPENVSSLRGLRGISFSFTPLLSSCCPLWSLR